jgi:hypothetical protein
MTIEAIESLITSAEDAEKVDKYNKVETYVSSEIAIKKIHKKVVCNNNIKR